MESAVFEIVAYHAWHQARFEELNRQWIEKYFSMEPIDFEVLQHPEEYILKTGGKIFVAEVNGEVAGTVALKKVNAAIYEMTKMAVDEKFRGRKIGQSLATASLSWAEEAGAEKIILYSSTKLPTAIALYRKLGFREIAVDGPYQRSDIKMELNLNDN